MLAPASIRQQRNTHNRGTYRYSVQHGTMDTQNDRWWVAGAAPGRFWVENSRPNLDPSSFPTLLYICLTNHTAVSKLHPTEGAEIFACCGFPGSCKVCCAVCTPLCAGRCAPGSGLRDRGKVMTFTRKWLTSSPATNQIKAMTCIMTWSWSDWPTMSLHAVEHREQTQSVRRTSTASQIYNTGTLLPPSSNKRQHHAREAASPRCIGACNPSPRIDRYT